MCRRSRVGRGNREPFPIPPLGIRAELAVPVALVAPRILTHVPVARLAVVAAGGWDRRTALHARATVTAPLAAAVRSLAGNVLTVVCLRRVDRRRRMTCWGSPHRRLLLLRPTRRGGWQEARPTRAPCRDCSYVCKAPKGAGAQTRPPGRSTQQGAVPWGQCSLTCSKATAWGSSSLPPAAVAHWHIQITNPPRSRGRRVCTRVRPSCNPSSLYVVVFQHAEAEGPPAVGERTLRLLRRIPNVGGAHAASTPRAPPAHPRAIVGHPGRGLFSTGRGCLVDGLHDPPQPCQGVAGRAGEPGVCLSG